MRVVRVAAAAPLVALVMLMAGCAMLGGDSTSGPLTIARQGSFYVGGTAVTAAGKFDQNAASPSSAGQTFWIDQMYVQYQVPLNPRKLPLVLVHGGGGSARVWETTPDGREGYQTIFLRRGFPVYIVDLPRGGRSGFPSFTGEFGKLDDTHQIIPPRTSATGREQAWSRWRLGPQFPDTFAVQAFPMSAVDSFLKHVRPIVTEDPAVMAAALVALLDEIGPAILVTHSNSGLYGWLAAVRSPNVKAIVSYEPAFVFPKDQMPSPVPLYGGSQVTGSQPAGSPVSGEDFAKLARIPVQVVFGDNIPTKPVPVLLADGRRAQVITSRLFVAALNSQGGRAELLLLPEAGLHGNSHFAFSDLNNGQVADQLSAFLRKHGLDAR